MNCIMIGIAGGSGSGKSTFTNRLKKEFGDQVTVIYHDNYYKSNDGIPFEVRQKVNYDHPDAFETDLLIAHLKALRRGECVQCPVYNYAEHRILAGMGELPHRIVDLHRKCPLLSCRPVTVARHHELCHERTGPEARFRRHICVLLRHHKNKHHP